MAQPAAWRFPGTLSPALVLVLAAGRRRRGHFTGGRGWTEGVGPGECGAAPSPPALTTVGLGAGGGRLLAARGGWRSVSRLVCAPGKWEAESSSLCTRPLRLPLTPSQTEYCSEGSKVRSSGRAPRVSVPERPLGPDPGPSCSFLSLWQVVMLVSGWDGSHMTRGHNPEVSISLWARLWGEAEGSQTFGGFLARTEAAGWPVVTLTCCPQRQRPRGAGPGRLGGRGAGPAEVGGRLRRLEPPWPPGPFPPPGPGRGVWCHWLGRDREEQHLVPGHHKQQNET